MLPELMQAGGVAEVPGLSGAEHDRRAEQSAGLLDRLQAHTHIHKKEVLNRRVSK